MDERTSTTATTEIFVLVRVDEGERTPYVPFSGRCRCGCGGVVGDCCCSSH